MGRKNYDSIPLKYRPLEWRTSIVITRQKNFTADGCNVVNSVEEALKKAKEKEATTLKPENQQLPLGRGAAEVFIIGGADIYKQTLGIADKLYITHIHHSFEGDAFFPKIDLAKWKLTSQKDVSADEKNKFPFSFCVYEKIKQPA